MLVILSIGVPCFLVHELSESSETTAIIDPHPSCPAYGCPHYPHDLQSIIENEKLKGSIIEDTIDNDHATMMITYKGNQHPFNQDRAVYIRPFGTNVMEELDNHQTVEEVFFIGLFDGHGKQGHKVADYVTHMLPRAVANLLERNDYSTDSWWQEQLIQVFQKVNRDIPAQEAYQGGCTASVVVRVQDKLYFANTGDSLTLLVDEAGKILYATRRDKPHLPAEKARIEGLGGKVHVPHPPKPAGLSRVVVFAKHADPPEQIGLAMSRSLGDWDWKDIGVIPDPIVDVVDLSHLPENLLVVSASDGLWDLRKREYFAHQFARQQRESSQTRFQSFVELVRKVAPEKGYRDDISVTVVPIANSK